MRSSKYAHKKEEWVEKYNKGMSFRAIAIEEGLYPTTVQNVIKDEIIKRPKSPFDKFSEKWKELYVMEGYLITEIANRYKTSFGVVYRVLENEGVAPERKELTERRKYTHLVETWVEQYNSGLSLTEIANTCEANRQTVLNHLKENGVRIRDTSETSRHYNLDETYFEEINTPAKAFWVGVFFARGSTLKHVRSQSIQLTLRESKCHLLDAFCEAINTEKPYTKRINEDLYELRLHSRPLYEQMQKIGLLHRKKSNQTFPEQLPEEFHEDILRGYIAAKGYYNYSSFFLNGTQPFLDVTKRILAEKVGVPSDIKQVSSNGSLHPILQIKPVDVPVFREWLRANRN